MAETRKVVLGGKDVEDLDRRRRDADRAHDGQHGPVASGDARHRAHRPHRRRRDESRRRRPARLPAPLLREGSRARDVHAGLPVHRPPQLRLADDQQRRLRDGGREAARHRRPHPRARAVHPRDRQRDVAHHRPPDVHGAPARWSSARSRSTSGRIKAREWLYELLEKVSGARLTHSYVRVGGVAYDLPPDFAEKLLRAVRQDRRGPEGHRATRCYENKIFRDRMDGIGVISQERALVVRLDRPDAALDRRRLRRAQGASVSRLRPLRLRRAGRHEGRLLRPLHRAPRGDAAVDPHPRSRRSSRSRPAR